MIRNLKILIAAAMALAAFGAISASGAQAAEFHCGAEPCTVEVLPDGIPGPTGKTAHQVFIVKQGASSVSTTCQQVTGHGTSETKTFNTLTLTDIVYHKCNVAGEASTVKMNGCHYHFSVGGHHDATPRVTCPDTKKIEIEVPATGCLITIGNTELLTGGLTFHDAETNETKETEITAEVTVTGIPTTVANNKCPGGLKAEAATGEYTTGNVELTGLTDPSKEHVKLWWT